MKNLLLIVLLALGSTLNAQLFVKPTATDASYVYVNNTYVYVENDVELESNLESAAPGTDKGISNIILRNNAQLLQGEGSDRDNKGTGEISIYQEGTVNNFDYNLWSSPVGVSRNGTNSPIAPGNGEFSFRDGTAGYIESVFFKPTTVTLSNPTFGTGGYDGSTNSGMLSIANYWIWSYQSGVDYAAWNHITNTGTLGAGYGFTMKGVSGMDATIISSEINQPQNNPGDSQRYDFRGRPNSGDIEIEVGASTITSNTQTLVGNPYPSALDLNYFLLQNSRDITDPTSTTFSELVGGNTVSFTRESVINGSAYFWDSNPLVMSHYLTDYQGGYGTYSSMGTLGGNGIYLNAVFYMYDVSGAIIPGSETDPANPQVATSYARRFSPVGQGFFVTGALEQDESSPGIAELITFSNKQRVFVKENPSSSTFRTSESTTDEDFETPGVGVSTYYADVNNMDKLNHIKFSVGINDTYSRELAIAFMDNATEGYDIAMDATTVDNVSTDITFTIGDTNNFVINAVPKDEFQWVPLFIRTSGTTELKFFVHYTEEFEYNEVYLVDRLTEEYHTILNEEVLMVLEDGIYEDRFFIRFTKEAQADEETTDDESTEEDEEEETTEETSEEVAVEIAVNEQNPFIDESVLESFTIIQNNNNGQLEIYNPNNVVVTNVSLFDLTGKQIFNEVDLGGQLEYTFPTSNLATGVYVVKFVTRDGLTKGRKISIVN